MRQELSDKYSNLCAALHREKKLAVAFSAGVDSTLLLKAAVNTLGNENVLAVTALKKVLFTQMMEAAREKGFTVMAEGSNVDDLSDYRPGLKAIEELGVRSPLREAGLTKAEIRELSSELGLPTWNKPSFACLATRFVYGETISDEKLRRVELGERLLQDLGFKQFRVRIHGEEGRLARIEVLPGDLGKLLKKRQEITSEFRKAGFDYTAMDLEGYRTGSMNEVLN